jgi:hypothetical protein
MSETIVGQCQAIIEKPSGWTEFEIAVPGKQYPVKLATKKEELIVEARAVKDTVATWAYNEVESEKVNEHTGKPYVNRYLEGVEAGAQAQAESSTASGSPEPHHEPLHFADKDRAITRMAVLKAAAQIYMGRGTILDTDFEEAPDIPLAVMKAAQRFEQWVYRDLEPPPF